MWFTYLLVFFNVVLKFDKINSGLLLLIGQVADAVSTTFVGIECDKSTGIRCLKYGNRKIWHLIGTICIVSSFPFIFTPCIGCNSAHVHAQMVYYSAFVIIFQFGWASVQISHLALIPELTPSDNQRTQLTTIRYTFTVVSTVVIYILTWLSLKSKENDNETEQVGPHDAIYFQRVVYSGLVIGIITSILFHWGVKEDSHLNISRGRRNHKTVFQFLREMKFYQVAVVYMSSRLFVNIAQVYIPLYLHETLSVKADILALIPLLMYVGSITASTIVNLLNRISGRKIAFTLGSVIGISACIWIKFGKNSNYEIYPISFLLGFSGSILIVTSLGLTADLIGFDTDTSAFVYGAMSFADKLSNGVVVMGIQYIICAKCPSLYQNVLVYICGGSILIGMMSNLSLKLATRKKFSASDDERRPILQRDTNAEFH
ncbi:hypothetical protein RUM44_011766 [Polyplax serrata]|uniref:Major facilitator superfamily domain-containing protein 12-like n=1 Tax=Polyplax serrata TaxID=468196 RepID=A0ABR1ARL6_POLSC